jgi:hypothetical protein
MAVGACLDNTWISTRDAVMQQGRTHLSCFAVVTKESAFLLTLSVENVYAERKKKPGSFLPPATVRVQATGWLHSIS